MTSKITKALRTERQEANEKNLKDRDPAEWREYIANKREPLRSQNETTGY